MTVSTVEVQQSHTGRLTDDAARPVNGSASPAYAIRCRGVTAALLDLYSNLLTA